MNISFENIKKYLNEKFTLTTKEGTIENRNLSKTDRILKEIEEKHNHSWYKELYSRNKNTLDDTALIYRGNRITYKDIFSKMEEYAKSLKAMGIGVDSEIPVCISNCPEIVYLMGAASMVGAKLNIFGSNFPNDYVTEIINNSKSDIIFVEDNAYEKISKGIDKSNCKKIVMTSLRDSLKYNINPFKDIDEKYKVFDNKVNAFKEKNDKIINQKEFLEIGKDYEGKLVEDTNMDQDFLITYTSGSTNELRPKGIVHSSRNFILIARYHDKDMNGITTKPFTSLAHIPTYSNTNLVSCISDSLMQGAKLALEPIYDKDHFIASVVLHNPHYVAATKSFWLNAAKKVLYDEKYENVKCPNLLLAFSCGEPLELNEEKLINKALKKIKAGTGITKTPNSLIRLCEAAGDCEHGSIFYTLLRSYSNKKPYYLREKTDSGLAKFDFVDVAVLDENNNPLGPNKYGRIVANSPCTMKRYNNDEEATKAFFIKDSNGKEWADMSVYGYIDSNKKIHIKGRIPKKDEIIPSFMISQEVLKDRKNILSCEAVDQGNAVYVIHIELQPDSKEDPKEVLKAAHKRCEKLINEADIVVYYKIRSNNESFPLTGSGKRSTKALKAEGISPDCLTPYYKNGALQFESRYFEDEKKKVIIYQ